jgi:hypothetical protein
MIIIDDVPSNTFKVIYTSKHAIDKVQIKFYRKTFSPKPIYTNHLHKN